MNFQDNIGVLEKNGAIKRMYPKSVNGFLFKARRIFGYSLLTFLFAAPFLTIKGQPLLLLNVLERKFIIFGQIFFPQDFYLFALAMLTFMVFVILFTVVFGRVFCGWACPQTVFLELIFRQIERLIEGDANQQRKLDASAWTTEKIWKKSLKHTLFTIISFAIANTFLAYLVGIEELQKLITHSPLHNLTLFVSLVIFTGLFYYVFARFRELVCIVVCPYGRLQSVFLDNKSIVVAYDFVRGEPRGKLKKSEVAPPPAPPLFGGEKRSFSKTPLSFGCCDNSQGQGVGQKGDCIDCKLCVQVCPTGIDIRNGTQLECINCTACIDVCDDVMEKINKPKKLIRYDSMEGITEKKPLRFTTRIAAYSVVLALLLGILSFLLISRKPVEITVLRTSGMLYQEADSLTMSNLYNVELVNKTPNAMNLELKVKDNLGTIKFVTGEKTLNLPSQNNVKGIFFVLIPKKEIHKLTTKIVIEVYDVANKNILVTEAKTSFLSPNAN